MSSKDSNIRFWIFPGELMERKAARAAAFASAASERTRVRLEFSVDTIWKGLWIAVTGEGGTSIVRRIEIERD